MENLNTSKMKASKVIIIILACLVAFGPLSIDMYLSALPSIASDLNVGASQVKQTVTIFLVGFSFGMLVYGPLSDRYGRKKLLIIGILFYLMATIGILFIKSIEALLAFRLLQALGGASASVLARAIVRDLYPLNEAAKILSWMNIVTMVATIIAPLFGSFLLKWFDWQSIFMFLFIFAGVTLLSFVLKIPETHVKSSRLISLTHVIAGYYSVLKDSKAMTLIVCMSSAFAGMFVYITLSPFIFIKFFNFTEQQYAYLFASNITGILIMTFINASIVTRLGPLKMVTLCTLILFISALGLLFFTLIWIVPVGIMASLFFFVAMTGSLNANCIALLLGMYEKNAGTASGLAISIQFGLGGGMSFLVSLLTTTNPWPMGIFMFVMGSISLVALLLFKRSVSCKVG
ncbi:multidrug effflux MFS transporter [Thorsellia kenyensis]|uniref:Bcr/CflA family efflux transporter n=1 Tax=Thorsellia kenyensis TaxID=1549888 RepID=A0ABV6CER7_9GAMM